MDIKTLREEFAKCHADAKKIIAKGGEEKRALTGEETQEKERLFARMDAIEQQVKDETKLAAMKFEAGEAQVAQKLDAEVTETEQRFTVEQIKADLRKFARGLNHGRSLYTTTSGTQSAAYLPKEVIQPYLVRRTPNVFRAIYDFWNVQPITRTNTESLSMPVEDDTANDGATQSESASSANAGVDPVVTGTYTFLPNLRTSDPRWVSNTVAFANDFDITAYWLPLLLKRVDKAEETDMTTKLRTGTAGLTTASTSAITYAELLTWEHSLPVAYRSDFSYVLSDSLYKLIRGLVDNNGRPIMDLDPTNKFQATIHGKPVFVSEFLDAMGTVGNKVGAVVSADAWKIYDCGPTRMVRYFNQPGYPDQVGYEIFKNGDSTFISNGVRIAKN